METSNQTFAEEIIKKAKEEAVEMIASGEVIKEIDFGREGGTFFVSSDSKKIIGPEIIDVDGKVFYVGILKK